MHTCLPMYLFAIGLKYIHHLRLKYLFSGRVGKQLISKSNWAEGPLPRSVAA